MTLSPSDAAAVPQPEVSIVIPVHGARAGLGRCLASALVQSHVSLEIVLVDDGSPCDPFSEVADLLADPRVRILRHERNKGVSAARNSGAQAARGRYVAFLDSDDEWQPGKLAAQLASARAAGEPELFFCITASERRLPGGKRDVRPRRGLSAGERPGDYLYIEGAMMQTSSFFVSRPLPLAAPFAEELRQYEDHLFFLRAMAAGAHFAFVAQPLSIYHDEGSAGRLSADKSIPQCDAYERLAAPLLGPRALSAFRARYRARLLLESAPRDAFHMVARALRENALRPRFLAGFIRQWWRARRQAKG